MYYEACWELLKTSMSNLHITKGDILYIASDVTLLLAEARKKYQVKTPSQRDKFLNEFVNILQSVVGEKGTLLFPVFTWSFCRGEGFAVKNTLGEVGAFNNWLLNKRSDFSRTQHPIYSFMVWGGQAKELLALNNTDSFGCDSPFAYLHHHGGKMLLLNVTLQRGFTFLHYIEEMVRVPYRYMKNFRGIYVDGQGKRSERSYTMYVRDLSIESKEIVPDELLECRGIVDVANWGELTLKTFSLADAYPIVEEDLLYNSGKQCYKFENYSLEWGKGATHADDLSN